MKWEENAKSAYGVGLGRFFFGTVLTFDDNDKR